MRRMRNSGSRNRVLEESLGRKSTARGELTSQKFVSDTVNSWNEIIWSRILLSNSSADVRYFCYEIHISYILLLLSLRCIHARSDGKLRNN